MLRVEHLDVFIESSHILRRVSLAVDGGELVALVGRNGAGKTTTLRAVMGYLRPAGGRVEFQGRSLVGLRPHRVARLGIAFAPEDSGIFGGLTVAENIEMATWTRDSPRPAAERLERAWGVFPQLRRHARRRAAGLSGGERKMLSIARALALDPTLLLLDEPFEGLAPALVPQVSAGIAAIAALGCAVLLAESNVHHVPRGTARLYVLERGEIVYAGLPAEAARDRRLQAILGGVPGDGRPAGG